MHKKIYFSFPIAVIAIAYASYFVVHKNSTQPLQSYLPHPIIENLQPSQQPNVTNNPDLTFIGPRKNVLKEAPKDEGFWSFAMPVPNTLSRSGQPTFEEFQWLKEHGWKSDIDLRINNDHNEQADDAQIPGFNELGFNYLHIQIIDGAAPTNEQAEQFLQFVTSPANLPAHVHCRGGIGRAGTMVALYRYSVQAWPMDKAIEESKKFSGGVSSKQKQWLAQWAQSHQAGSYAK